jgi:hypothetical protein
MRINVIAGLIITALGSPCAVATSSNHYDLERRIFDTSYCQIWCTALGGLTV